MPKSSKTSPLDAAKTSGTSPTFSITPRGLRIEQAAQYSGLSPFYIEELIRNGTLPAIGGPGTGIAAYVVLREHLDEYLDELGEQAVERADERAEQRRKKTKAA
jgi:histone H3/H4